MTTYSTESVALPRGKEQGPNFQAAASHLVLVVALFVYSFAVGPVSGDELLAEWPEFRGPGGQGQSTATDLPETWSETENVVWRTELPGRGWSSPVIQGDQIWMTTAVEEKLSDEDLQSRIAAKSNSESLSFIGAVHLHALCVDRNSGAILRNIELLQQ
ncbi:MAG: PQQ-binding-like beta-propeller repeat protein, partial [Planctomycetota bacterium]|nr:PQQ-binding-like beta-propeller repeat protein [Planctomycetota bacterium]